MKPGHEHDKEQMSSHGTDKDNRIHDKRQTEREQKNKQNDRRGWRQTRIDTGDEGRMGRRKDTSKDDGIDKTAISIRTYEEANVRTEGHGLYNKGNIQDGGLRNTDNKETQDDRDQGWRQRYGDEREHTGKEQKEESVRIGTYNIGTLPDPGSLRSLHLQQEIKDFSCIGLSELNKNWYKVQSQNSFRRQAERWWKTQKTNFTWLREFKWPSAHQFGGVSLTTTNKLSNYVQEKGEDESGLGRWVWQKLEGHSEIKTMVLQIYRPIKTQDAEGSVFFQQQAAGVIDDPLKVFDEDLLELIDAHMVQGFQLIVMGDFNTRLNRRSQLEKELNQRGIREVVQERYGNKTPPNTHIRGSSPIDGIFASETIQIAKGGYTGGREEISDHRLIWADFTLDSLLGTDRGEIIRTRGKRLQLSNKQATKKFNKLFRRQIRNHKLLERLEKLLKEIGSERQLTDKQKEEYNAIYEQRGRATQFADKRCARLPANDHPFSMELKQAMGRASIYKGMEKRLRKKRRIHHRWLIDKKKFYGITDHIEILDTVDVAKEMSRKAYRVFREKQANSLELRHQYLEHLIQQAISEGNEKKRKEISAIREREQIKDVHSRIKYAQGKIRGGGVRFIHTEDTQGHTNTIKDKFRMELAIRQANESKLQAANESPVRQGDLGSIITDHDYEQWESFLSGKVDIQTDMNEGTRKWLETFQGTQIQDQDMTVTTDNYIRSWNMVKEHTSCVPGQVYFGTFKAMRWCREAAEIHTALANIPIQTGHTPDAWRSSVDSMLPKKPGEWRPHKLRLTSLMSPDFNHNNKILGRAAMKMAEEKNLLASEQYGSRKGLSAVKHALNKRLLLDILRTQRRPGVLCANDAKACYDRILHFAVYVSMRRAGLRKEAIKSMLEPIRRMRHKIRTAYGDSAIEYGGDNWDRDPSGICQGNGAGPAIWAIVSSPLLELLRESGYGAKLHAAIGDCFLHLCGFAFVDDADTIQTGEPGEETTTIISEAQKELNLWEEAIRATGGGIEGDKSDFVVINFRWTSGTWRYEKKNPDNKITVFNPNGPREQLTQLDISEARRTLGVWQAADGNEEEQAKRMQQKADKWSRAVARSTLGRSDTVVGIRTTLYPSVTFGAMATTLTQQQCQEVFKPVRKGALSKSGYMKTIPAVILHAPEKFGGIGLMDLYTIQGIEHLKALLDEGGTDSPTGRLIEILLHDHAMELGVSGYFFDQDYERVHMILTDSWMKHTLRFVSENNITVEHKQKRLYTWRRHDTWIMDDILQAQGVHISNAELAATNRCRIYLRAVTRSDITDGGGNKIIDAAWRCIRDFDTPSGYAYKWPFQPRPNRQDIRTWQKVLTKVYGLGNRIQRWQQPMGSWSRRSGRYTQWMYDEPSDSLYQRNGQAWTRWRRMNKRTRSNQFTICNDEDTEQQVSRWKMARVLRMPIPSVVVGLGSGRMHAGETSRQREDRGSGDQGERVARRTPSLAQGARRIPVSLRWLLEKVRFPVDNGRHMARQIITGKAKCISDGSSKLQLGTSAATFISEDDETSYLIANRTPGDNEDQHAYRSELVGLLTNVIFLNIVAEVHGIEEGRVEIACDNESALWRGFNGRTVTCRSDSFDILRVLKHAIKESPIQWTTRHVRGHQDEGTHIDDLDEWAIGNILCDKEAETHWTQNYGDGSRNRPSPGTMPGEGWRVLLNDRVVVNNIGKHIHEYISYIPVMQYWEKKGRIKQGMGEFVDWDKYGRALNSMPFGKRQWVRKHYCGFEATNWMLYQCQKRTQPFCPKCDKIETHRHIMQCQSDSATRKFRDLQRSFSDWLQNTTTPGLKDAILAHLRAYREEEEVVEGDHWSDELRVASKLQEALGPSAFAEGCLEDSWEQLQAVHLQTTGSKRTPARWVTELIKKLWNISWDMWDHRNGWVHRETEIRKEQIAAQLDDEIDGYYQTGTNNRFLRDVERRFFSTPIEKIKQKTEHGKRVWIHMAKRFIAFDKLRVASCQETRRIREYIQPGSTTEIERNSRGILNRYRSDYHAPEGTRRDQINE